MTLSLLAYDAAPGVLLEALDAEPSQLAGVADLVRGYVTAHGASPRAVAVRRICRAAAPAFTLDESVVSDACDLLEREGDVVLADGGVLFATPLRAVKLDGQDFRIASSLPTRRLATLLIGSWNVAGTSRRCRVDDTERASAAVIEAGGVVLTPSAWARLDRVPAADQRWLESLELRLRSAAEAASSLERDEALAWSGYVATDSGLRWKAANAGEGARLWRARNRWGHWHHAWTEQGTPASSRFVSLRRDEGTRTVFAVAAALGVPAEISVARHADEAIITVPQWLPFAEYRYLAVSASLSASDRGATRWTVPSASLATVLGTLVQRLGIVVREETP